MRAIPYVAQYDLEFPPKKAHHGVKALRATQEAADAEYMASSGAIEVLENVVNHLTRCGSSAPEFNEIDVMGEIANAVKYHRWKAGNVEACNRVSALVATVLRHDAALGVARSTKTAADADELKRQLEASSKECDDLSKEVPSGLQNDAFFPTSNIRQTISAQLTFTTFVADYIAHARLLDNTTWKAADLESLGSSTRRLLEVVAALPSPYAVHSSVVAAATGALQRTVTALPLLQFMQQSATPQLWHSLLRLPAQQFAHKIAAAVRAQNVDAYSAAKVVDLVAGTPENIAIVEQAVLLHAHKLAAEAEAAAAQRQAARTSAKKEAASEDNEGGPRKGRRRTSVS